ncbi:MAG TPA: metal-dependent hydrolase [Bryobacteraceae bacterium]|jgi:inner membrane protein
MDNLTHSLTGLMLSRAGLNRLTPRASLLLILTGNAPDIDTVSWLGGTARYLEIHRGYTHSWVMVPVLSLVAAVFAWWSMRWPKWAQRPVGGVEDRAAWSWWKAWLIGMIGVASHLLLDWTNNYGIRWGLPFDSSWHRLDLLFVIDPWVWIVLLLAVAGPFLSRLVSGEIGAGKTTGFGAAWFALIVLSIYIGGRFLLHGQAIQLLSERVYDEQTPRRVAAFPEFGNPFRWRAVAELGNGYWVSQIRPLEGFDPAEGRLYYQAPAQPAITAASETSDFRSFVKFNQFPLWHVIPLTDPDGAMRVELYDMRFGDPSSPGFVATATIEGGRPENESLRFGAPKL